MIAFLSQTLSKKYLDSQKSVDHKLKANDTRTLHVTGKDEKSRGLKTEKIKLRPAM